MTLSDLNTIFFPEYIYRSLFEASTCRPDDEYICIYVSICTVTIKQILSVKLLN